MPLRYLKEGKTYDEYADVKTVRERRQNADRQARFKAKQTVTAAQRKPANEG
jgi:hypothetical protein